MTDMNRLDPYRKALQPTPVAPDPELATLIIETGLGPFWHDWTGDAAFRPIRLAAEAMYAMQRSASTEIDVALSEAGIESVFIKGVANRERLYPNPALRQCADLDLLVRRDDRFRATEALQKAGFEPRPDPASISRELVLSRGVVDIDLHWELLRQGRLRQDPSDELIARRQRVNGLWMPNPNDAAFLLLVHPAFAKNISVPDMGLHRVLDIVRWQQTEGFDLATLTPMLEGQGVKTAAWAVLRWVQLLNPDFMLAIDAWRPGRLRGVWLESWLEHDWSTRLVRLHALRLVGLSPFLHDTAMDALRAFNGWQQARRGRKEDLRAFARHSG